MLVGIDYEFLWLPSHKGALPVFLQLQKNKRPSFSAVYLTGLNSDPLCDPSQKGCLLLCPHEHQK